MSKKIANFTPILLVKSIKISTFAKKINMKELEILSIIENRMGISSLNDMQKAVLGKSSSMNGDIVLYSPTGSGKTLAYIIPVLKALKDQPEKLQVVIIVPSRELALQIFDILRVIAEGHKVTCCYGGHKVEDEKNSLIVVPEIIVSTPGRLLDHCQRGNIDITNTKQLVIDEFDKCLELGFEDEMKKLIKRMPNLSRRFLTSATMIDTLPEYLRLNSLIEINFSHNRSTSKLKVWQVSSDAPDKLDTLKRLLLSLPEGKSIVFANYRDAVERIHASLVANHIAAGLYHGALDQLSREMAVSMFHNGTYPVLVTTDLGSRGLDISEVKNIIHYHMPVSSESYTHRNGRTARQQACGDAFVIVGPTESVPDYVAFDDEWHIPATLTRNNINAAMATLYFMAGKKEKISKGDIVGFIANNSGNVSAKEIGQIDVRDHYAIVAVPRNNINETLSRLQQAKIKGKRVRISLVKELSRG